MATPYDINRSFFHRCFYSNETGDPNNVESGFLKGRLLLKVCRFHADSWSGEQILLLLQTFKHIFTSPSSVDIITEGVQPTQKCRRLQTSERTVAKILGMDNQVAPRGIAYAAVQVRSLPRGIAA